MAPATLTRAFGQGARYDLQVSGADHENTAFRPPRWIRPEFGWRGGPAAADGRQTPTAASAATLPIPQPAPGFVQPKTPWGDPDLQGFWPGVEMVGVPLQRPARFGTRNVLTDEEFAQRASEIKEEEESLLAEIDVFTADVTTPCAIRCPTSPKPHWQETGKPSRQASLIIDPPDGRQPPLSAEGQKRQAQQQAEARRGASGSRGARRTAISIAASTTAASRAASWDRSCRPSTTTATRSCRRRASSSSATR